MPTPEDMRAAAQGYLTEQERWQTMILDFCQGKLADDPDWQTLDKLARTLHLDSARANLPPGKIFQIIARSRYGRETPEREDAMRFLTGRGVPVVLHLECARLRLMDSRSLTDIGVAYTGELCEDCEKPLAQEPEERVFSETQVRQLLYVIGLHTPIAALEHCFETLEAVILAGYTDQVAELLMIARGTWHDAGPYSVGGPDASNMDLPTRDIW